ncbi:hypothetical protein QTP70_027959 [Hemibagrus guttatus]|uniref:Uncharacterized protein n=1 Tax=Hemibagrus guttatus TaxID=175788 RepID=A0AAE0QJP5_9TELE|nr:hypothetical protein QTP70_027959 [Hemibagrus guttatus]
MPFADLLEQVGSMGRFQLIHVTLLSIPILVMASHNLLQNFVAAVPPHHCTVHTNLSASTMGPAEMLLVSVPMDEQGKLERCRRYVHPQWNLLSKNSSEDLEKKEIEMEGCVDGWSYNRTDMSATIITEWDLVCDSKSLKQMGQTIYMGGVLLGALVFGGLSDKFGRRMLLMISNLLLAVAGTCTAFASSFSLFCLFRFFCGMALSGIVLNSFSLSEDTHTHTFGYAPQVGCELEEKERFWNELDEVMESIPTSKRVVIGADFNGHVGEGNTSDEEVMGKFGVKERNLEGQMVVDFAKRMDMAVVNTYFQKREEHRVTYKSGGRRTQVDYILCRRGNLKEISDCKVVVGESVARQHRMVVCRMTLMVCKKKKRSEIEKKTKWWKLKKEECCAEFRQKLRQALGGQVVLPDDWETTAEVIRETGRKVLGVSSGRRKEDKETWQRDRDGKDVQQVRVIKDRDGRVLTSEESVQRRWKEYFEELMNEENEREKRVEGVNSVEQKVDKIRSQEGFEEDEKWKGSWS